MGMRGDGWPAQERGSDASVSQLQGTLALWARVFASAYGEAGFHLDGTLISAGELDRMAQSLRGHLEGRDEETDREVLEDFLGGAGAYLGQVILSHFGGAWVSDASGQPQIVGLGETVVRPFDWIAERLEGEGMALLWRMARLNQRLRRTE
jgi:hypothetical protein